MAGLRRYTGEQNRRRHARKVDKVDLLGRQGKRLAHPVTEVVMTHRVQRLQHTERFRSKRLVFPELLQYVSERP